MDRMFRPKKVLEFSLQRTSKKFLNDKENIQRIKHLRTIIDNVTPSTLKKFMLDNYSLIFNSFYDVYSNVVAELIQKPTSSHYKELQNILVVLEKIFVTLPELIRSKWQFNCICSILKNLLHPKNIIKVRLRGIRLFVLWFQILNSDAPEPCLEIFINLIPIFYPIIKSKICPEMFRSKRTSETGEDIISVSETDMKPIIIQNIEKDFEPDNSNHHLLRFLLRYMVTEGLKVDWKEDAYKKQIDCYNFLFDKFKEFYLPAIFPKCLENYTLEKNQTMLISMNELDSYYTEYKTYLITFSEVGIFQEEVILWLCELTYNQDFIKQLDENLGRSNANSSKTLHNYLVKFEDECLQLTNVMLSTMRHILFESTENVNVINQLLQHSFFLPPQQFSRAQFGVLCVYQSWLFTKDPPSFMLHTDDSYSQHQHILSLNDSSEQRNKSPIKSWLDRRNMEPSHHSVSESASAASSSLQVCVTMQRVIFTNVSLLFLHTSSPSKEIVSRAIDTVLRRSINSFSNLEVEHLMNILLDIGYKVLSRFTPQTRPDNSWIGKNGCLGQFFQTLNVLLVKASLTHYISEDLWNMYLAVYSRLHNWSELISEWIKTVKLLLKMLARYLYGVDLNDLPLERVERRHKTNNDNKKPSGTQTLERILRTEKQPSPRPPNKQKQALFHHAALYPTSQHLPIDASAAAGSINQHNSNQAPTAAHVTTPADGYMFMAGLQHLNDSDDNTPNTNTVNEASHSYKHNDEVASNPDELIRVENENELDSIASSSHEDNSSYISAEESSSPNTQAGGGSGNKNEYAMSDSDHAHLSSSGCETSFETNDNSYELFENIQHHNSDVMVTVGSDTHDEEDADDEDEAEGESGSMSNHKKVSESKSATLTRDESDIDLSGAMVPGGTVNEECKTPTKAATNNNPGGVSFKRKQQHSLLHSFKRQNGDRNSMNIEENISSLFNTADIRKAVSIDNINTHHISMRGTSIGWSDESVVILWKRFLGLLGNITLIDNKANLHSVLGLLDKVTTTLLNIRRNMGLGSSHPPCFVPPIEMISPWLFQIISSETHDTDAKVVCLQTLCKITVRRHDIQPSTHQLALFYKLVHRIVHANDTGLLYPLITSLGVHFFSQPLAGSEMLIGDLIRAADLILKPTMKMTSYNASTVIVPKKEILIILSQIIQFLRVSDEFLIMDPDSLDTKVISIPSSYKKQAVDLVMTCVRMEENLAARILALKIITNLCYSEITTTTTRSSNANSTELASDALMQLLGVIRWGCCSSHEPEIRLALLACDMIRVLVNCAHEIAAKLPHIPNTIIQVLCWTLSATWSCRRRGHSCAMMQRLLVSQIFALMEWCMCVSVRDGVSLSPQLVYLVFSTLQRVVDDQSPSPTDEHAPADPMAAHVHLYELSPVKDEPSSNNTSSNSSISEHIVRVVQLTARVSLCHLLNYLGHHPPPTDHRDSLGCCVQEHHDMAPSPLLDPLQEEALFESERTQVFAVNGSMIVTLLATYTETGVTLDTASDVAPGGPPITRSANNSLKNYPYPSSSSSSSSMGVKEIRVLIRDVGGKYCWDCKFISRPEDLINQPESSNQCHHPQDAANTPPSPPPRRHLPPVGLLAATAGQKSTSTAQKSLGSSSSSNVVTRDNLSKLFDEIGTESPELQLFSCSTSNGSSSASSPKLNIIESQLCMELVVKKHITDHNSNERGCFEKNHCIKISYPKLSDKHMRQNIPFAHAIESKSGGSNLLSNVYFCRQLLTELGYLSWKRRGSIEVMQKQKLSRELRALDKNTKVRDTHKVAVLYVGWGQEDKESILSNSQRGQSAEFCRFVEGLGRPVSLQEHQGFLGGLDSTGENRNGTHAPYFSTSNLEVMFHVSTWMPSNKKTDNPTKFKHLGNDDVMIIWSENYRDYISKITKTQFGEVMIIISPLRNGLFRVQIEEKKETKFHGPLYDGSIVGEQELPGLVRATAVNAGKAIRDFNMHFREYYIERAHYLENAIKNYKMDQTYEQFAETIYGSPKEAIPSSVSNSNNNNNHTNAKVSPSEGGLLQSPGDTNISMDQSSTKTLPSSSHRNMDLLENRSHNPSNNLSPQDEKFKTLKAPKVNK